MIGILCGDNETEEIREFFELFKTPWEFYDPAHAYDVVLSTGKQLLRMNSKLVVIYSSKKCQFDSEEVLITRPQHGNVLVEYNGIEIPIYGNLLAFGEVGKPLIWEKNSREVVGFGIDKLEGKILRLGFDLFQEISFLLSKGQPIENAQIPTLEIHISALRGWILEAGIFLVEIPPRPEGCDFIICLTHDVDFAGIRHHMFDHTMWGLIYRALFGSFLRVLKGRFSWRNLLRNWIAVLSLPCVYSGLCKDFWLQFEKYLEIEKEIKSTFFLIPFKNQAGKKTVSEDGRRAKWRAARYDITDVQDSVRNLLSHGYEIGLHGIDVWHNSDLARQELEKIGLFTGKPEIGIRVHWLYFDESSPKILDEVGFSYDSTFGYNSTVGYRGGTTQVFRPLGVRNILELPLHIQDMAMFSPNRMNLTENQAWKLCEKLFNNASKYYGVLTILWHLRSLGPERHWGGFYVRVLEELRKRHAWFATANQAIDWFKKRRAVVFEEVRFTNNRIRLSLKYQEERPERDFILRVYTPPKGQDTSSQGRRGYTDIPWAGENIVEMPFNEY